MSTNRYYPLWFLLPMLLLFTVLYAVPTYSSFYLSMTNWSSYKLNLTQVSFVGLEHFADLFRSADFVDTFRNTFVYAAASTLLLNGLGFGLALGIHSVTAKSLFRTVFFLPCILSPLVVGYMFSAIYNPAGSLNELLEWIGLGKFAEDWLGNADIALFSVIVVNVWQWTGFNMAIYVAGLQNVPKEIQEAAVIDGCGYRQRVRHILFPLVAPAFTINFILSSIGTLKTFDLVFVLTGGGPGHATEVVNTYIFKTFSQGLYAYGTAANVLLFLFIAVVSFITLNFLKKREVDL